MSWEDNLREKYGIAQPMAEPTPEELREDYWCARIARMGALMDANADRNDAALYS